MAVYHPLNIHRSMYFKGSKNLRVDPTNLMNKITEIVLVFDKALVKVAISHLQKSTFI